MGVVSINERPRPHCGNPGLSNPVDLGEHRMRGTKSNNVHRNPQHSKATGQRFDGGTYVWARKNPQDPMPMMGGWGRRPGR